MRVAYDPTFRVSASDAAVETRESRRTVHTLGYKPAKPQAEALWRA
jgi:hypothetical protein